MLFNEKSTGYGKQIKFLPKIKLAAEVGQR